MEYLPPELLVIIFTFLPVEMQYVTSVVCKRWLDLMPTKNCSPDELLLWTAENGHTDLCYLAKEWGCIQYNPWDDDMYHLFEDMFENACDGGHTHICKIWGEWTLYDNNTNSTRIDFDALFHGAITNDKEDMIKLAVEWDASFGDYLEYINSERSNFDHLLELSAENGSEKFCRIARECGATDFKSMFHWASECGHGNIRKLAIEWQNEEMLGKNNQKLEK